MKQEQTQSQKQIKPKEKQSKEIDLYFHRTPKLGTIYLKSSKFKAGHCNVCGKRRKTTAHHLVPKRLRCIFPDLFEIRIRVCDDCDEMFHPENRLIKVDPIIQKQNEIIKYLHGEIYWKSAKLNQITQQISNLQEQSQALSKLRLKTLDKISEIDNSPNNTFSRKDTVYVN